MPELSGFPSAEMQFDRNAKLVGDVGDVDAVRQLANGQSTDLLVMAHGWNNEPHEARDLYRQLAASLRAVLSQDRVPALRGRSIALVGVVWPSMKFADEDGAFVGGAAGTGSSTAILDLGAQVDALRVLFPDPGGQQTLDSVAALVGDLEDSADARRQFAELLKTLLDRAALNHEDASSELVAMDGSELMDRLAAPLPLALWPEAESIGGAAGFGDFLAGPLSAAKKLLNFTSYFEMKARSGNIGANGVAPVLKQIKQARPGLNMHLLGHSFGARLVSATANVLPTDSVASMTLLQGAFSHHGFARDFEPGRSGFFRDVVDHKTVQGPVLITNTAKDKAVGIAYAIASRVSNDAAAGLGDASDRYGGIGRNGAVRTAEAVAGRLLPVGGAYAFRPRALHNLVADDFISNHSDIKGPEVAYAVLSAIGAT